MRGLTVGQYPNIGRDTSIVEHVYRQRDDGFEPIVLDDPAADVALALAGIAGEQRRAVVNLGDARLPKAAPCFILDSMFARNIICPSLERVIRPYSGSSACVITKRGSRMPALPPMRSWSL